MTEPTPANHGPVPHPAERSLRWRVALVAIGAAVITAAAGFFGQVWAAHLNGQNQLEAGRQNFLLVQQDALYSQIISQAKLADRTTSAFLIAMARDSNSPGSEDLDSMRSAMNDSFATFDELINRMDVVAPVEMYEPFGSLSNALYASRWNAEDVYKAVYVDKTSKYADVAQSGGGLSSTANNSIVAFIEAARQSLWGNLK